MAIIHRRFKRAIIAATLCFAVAVIGCSSSPSDEQKRQLDDMKAEITSLEQQVSAKEKDKADLEKQVAEKNGKLQECAADQNTVKSSAK